MKFDEKDIEEACDALAMLQYFPHGSRGAVQKLLAKMCPHRESLRWLVGQLVNHVGSWPGPAEVRGILCGRYEPADGVDQWATLPGFTAADAEQRFLNNQHDYAVTDGMLSLLEGVSTRRLT